MLYVSHRQSAIAAWLINQNARCSEMQNRSISKLSGARPAAFVLLKSSRHCQKSRGARTASGSDPVGVSDRSAFPVRACAQRQARAGWRKRSEGRPEAALELMRFVFRPQTTPMAIFNPGPDAIELVDFHSKWAMSGTTSETPAARTPCHFREGALECRLRGRNSCRQPSCKRKPSDSTEVGDCLPNAGALSPLGNTRGLQILLDRWSRMETIELCTTLHIGRERRFCALR